MALQPSVFWIFAVYFYTSVAVAALGPSPSGRTSALRWLLWVNAVGSLGFLFASARFPSLFLNHNPMGQARPELFAVVLLVGLFSAAVEIPGFLLNSRSDRSTVSVIDRTADAILDVRLDPTAAKGQLEKLLGDNQSTFESLGLRSLLTKVVDSFARMGNVDTSMFDIALSELRRSRAVIESRSKHPVPFLPELLAVSSLTFILGEILTVLRGK
jgi:hypothetical protein